MKRLFWALGSMLVIVLSTPSLEIMALTKQDYKDMGLLPYKHKPYFVLGKLDKLGRPTWAHIQFHSFIDAESPKKYQDPKKSITGGSEYLTDYLPGFQGNDETYLISNENIQNYNRKAWSPRHLLSTLWTDSLYSNTIRNFGLITTYADEGYSTDSKNDTSTLQYYERSLSDWVSSSHWDSKKGYSHYLVDYKIKLIYQGDELVPRQIKLRYVGLTEQGKLKKINLKGKEGFDKQGIATVVIDNTAPNVTIDYMTGKVTGESYTPNIATSSPKIPENGTDETNNTYVYVDLDTGHYYYYEDARDLDSYLMMLEQEALDEGYTRSY